MQIDLGPLLGLITMTRPFCGAGPEVSLYVGGRHVAYCRSLYHRPCDTLRLDLKVNDITVLDVYHSRLLQLATVLTDLMLQATTRYSMK